MRKPGPLPCGIPPEAVVLAIFGREYIRIRMKVGVARRTRML